MIYAARLPHPKFPAHAAAYRLLETALWREYGMRDVWYAREEQGKPVLAWDCGVNFNVSHCRGLVACIVSRAQVGIDAEPIRERRPGVLRRAFTPEERDWVENGERPDERFFRLWTLKESFVKVVGQGLSYGLDRVPIRFDEGGQPVCGEPGYRFSQRVLWGEFVLSACVGPETTKEEAGQ